MSETHEDLMSEAGSPPSGEASPLPSGPLPSGEASSPPSGETSPSPSGATSPSPHKGKLTKRKLIVGAIALVAVTLLTLSALYLLGYLGGVTNDDGILIAAGARQGTLGGEEEIEEGSNGRTAMDISINGRPTFADGTSEGTLHIVNPETNILYMNAKITLDETGETIYNSDAIPPGYYIQYGKLTKIFEKGEYAATAHVSLIDPEDTEAVFNSADFKITLVVEN